MSKADSDVLQGTLDLLILKTLARGPQHGYGIVVRVPQVSHEVLLVEDGSLYRPGTASNRRAGSALNGARLRTTAAQSIIDSRLQDASSSPRKRRTGTS
jgi:hypothetical protein